MLILVFLEINGFFSVQKKTKKNWYNREPLSRCMHVVHLLANKQLVKEAKNGFAKVNFVI